MIVNERIVTYIQSLEKGNSQMCEKIEQYAIDTFVPIIRKETESFLKVMLSIKQPDTILEIGAGIGYSAILMSEHVQPATKITTIENYDKRIALAEKYIALSGKINQINLLKGDALQILPTLTEKFDFIFMDAAKGQYIHFLPDVVRLLNKGGVLISDNVLQDGEIVESRFGIERRNRTIHARMREYLYTLKNSEEFETSVIPLGDGITLSVRK